MEIRYAALSRWRAARRSQWAFSHANIRAFVYGDRIWLMRTIQRATGTREPSGFWPSPSLGSRWWPALNATCRRGATTRRQRRNPATTGCGVKPGRHCEQRHRGSAFCRSQLTISFNSSLRAALCNADGSGSDVLWTQQMEQSLAL
jgi:hypothetical protein